MILGLEFLENGAKVDVACFVSDAITTQLNMQKINKTLLTQYSIAVTVIICM